jgi:hypothetical protein
MEAIMGLNRIEQGTGQCAPVFSPSSQGQFSDSICHSSTNHLGQAEREGRRAMGPLRTWKPRMRDRERLRSTGRALSLDTRAGREREDLRQGALRSLRLAEMIDRVIRKKEPSIQIDIRSTE